MKVASIFGTTAAWGVLRGYGLHESVAIHGQLKIVEVLRTIAAAMVVVPRTVRACRSQRALWPWHAHQDFIDMPLGAVRAKFNIRVRQ